MSPRHDASRAIDLSSCEIAETVFGPRPRPHTQKTRTHNISSREFGRRAQDFYKGVGMLSYYYYGHKVLGGGVRNAPPLQGYCLPPVMTTFLACHRPAACDFRSQMALSAHPFARSNTHFPMVCYSFSLMCVRNLSWSQTRIFDYFPLMIKICVPAITLFLKQLL